MTDVYVVTHGSYSDYSINGVFSTRELAEDFIRRYNEVSNEGGSIEVWQLDEYRAGRTITTVCMFRNGDIHEIKTEPFLHTWKRGGFYHFQRRHLSDFSDSFLYWNIVDCPDDTTAIKIVNEKRAIILAHDYWGQPDKVAELFNGDK